MSNLDLNLDQILERNAKAVRKTGQRLDSLRVDLRLVEAEMDLFIVYHARRPDLAHVEVQAAGEIVFREAYTGKSAWQQQGDEQPAGTSPEGTAALRRGAIGNLYVLADFPQFGYSLELLEPAQLEDGPYYTLKITSATGPSEYHYLDPETFLATRQRDIRALHPDIDPTTRWTEDRRSDFREVDGMVWSFRSDKRDLNTDEIIQTTQLERVAINPAIKADFFEMPRPNP